MTAYGFGMIQVAWDDLPNLWGPYKNIKKSMVLYNSLPKTLLFLWFSMVWNRNH
jgi:hypothetical protein